MSTNSSIDRRFVESVVEHWPTEKVAELIQYLAESLRKKEAEQ